MLILNDIDVYAYAREVLPLDITYLEEFLVIFTQYIHKFVKPNSNTSSLFTVHGISK